MITGGLQESTVSNFTVTNILSYEEVDKKCKGYIDFHALRHKQNHSLTYWRREDRTGRTQKLIYAAYCMPLNWFLQQTMPPAVPWQFVQSSPMLPLLGKQPQSIFPELSWHSPKTLSGHFQQMTSFSFIIFLLYLGSKWIVNRFQVGISYTESSKVFTRG